MTGFLEPSRAETREAVAVYERERARRVSAKPAMHAALKVAYALRNEEAAQRFQALLALCASMDRDNECRGWGDDVRKIIEAPWPTESDLPGVEDTIHKLAQHDSAPW